MADVDQSKAIATGVTSASAMPRDPDHGALDLLIRGFQVSRMLRAVADAGVADRVPPHERISIAELAAACAVEPQPLLRVLRALAAFDVFAVAADATVTHTARSRYLRADATPSLRCAAQFWAAPGSWAAWGELDAALSGGVPHEAAWNTSRFAYLQQHPDEARVFDTMMATFPDNRHAAVAAAYDFSNARLIADIGGGNGAALRHILGRFPHARGLVFDRDDVVAAIEPAGLLDGRITAESGSFFDGVPAGADVYLLIRVLHDWPDDDVVRILRSCRAAMPSDALLLIGEYLLDPDPARGDPITYLIDTQMMAMFGSARERTADEFSDLLARADLTLRRIVPTPSAVRILEANARV